MRLICPNCGAQYEVDDRVVPEGGRDVQCSNCGHAWFQRPANWDDVAAEPDHDVATPEQSDAGAEDRAQDEPPVEHAEPDLVEESDPDEDEAPAPDLPRRELDEGVRGILAEEARREIEARAAEEQAVETQPDLGVDQFTDPEDERRREARERMARMRGIEEGETLEPEVAPEPDEPEEPEPRKHGRDVFPDIEEINSTLDTPAAPMPEPEPVSDEGGQDAPAKSSGFSRGFLGIVLLVALAFLVYYFSPKLVEMVPSLEPALAGYVDFVNTAMAGFNDWVQGIVAKLEAAATSE